MQYSATNGAQNCSIEVARKLIEKLTKLGFSFGDIHVNPQSGGEISVDMIPFHELQLSENGEYNLVIWSNNDWRNIALLNRTFGSGSITEFQRVSDELGISPQVSVQRIPGYVKAVESLIKKA